LVSKTELAIPLVIMFITLHVLQWISYTKIDVDHAPYSICRIRNLQVFFSWTADLTWEVVIRFRVSFIQWSLRINLKSLI
jgi:hypothetical protein